MLRCHQYLAALLMVFAACSSRADETAIGTQRTAIGEPAAGFPNWDERVIHLWVNRARADPQTELADCTNCAEAACYSPQPPLRWSHELNRAARFHSANQTSCGMSHDSRCTLVGEIDLLYPDTCDGAAACACQSGGCTCTGTCTSTWARIGMFGASGSGENVAGGGLGNPLGRFYAWLYETYDKTDCGFDYGPPTNGHRHNILANGGPGLGVGCIGSYCTQDFGSPAAAADQLIVGVHYPQSGTVSFRAHWYDPSGGAPEQAMVNIDGTCQAMAVERGITADNATYLLADQLISACAHYYFVFKDSSSNWVTYPESGSYAIGCGVDYDSAIRPELGASCDCTADCGGKQCGDDGCGGNCPPGCGANQTCESGACLCTALTCGSECCSAGQVCYADHCCSADCSGKDCGGDGCGDLCGTCPGSLTCDAGGRCGCSGDLSACGVECVNTTSDVDNCGECDLACVAPQVCASSSCSDSCAPGQEDCAGSCADLAVDPTHCGDCAISCSPGADCSGGLCSCAGGLVECPDVGCTDVRTDPDNCGVCGRHCVGCSEGTCPASDSDGGAGSFGASGDLHGGCAVGPSTRSGRAATLGALLLCALVALIARRRRRRSASAVAASV